MNRLSKLLEKLSGGSISVQELEELRSVLENDTLSQEYLKNEFKKAPSEKIYSYISNTLWLKIENKIKHKQVKRNTAINHKKLIGIAASVVLFLSIGILSWSLKKERNVNPCTYYRGTVQHINYF